MPRAKHLVFRLTDLHPGVTKDFFRAWPAGRIFSEQLRKEEFGFRRDVVGKLQVLFADISVELLIILPSERELATQQSEQKYS